MAKNGDLRKAKDVKNDEFYTRLEDINAELIHYEEFFKGKTIFMNCDDPTWSNFWRYFHIEFERLGLKKIISTHYEHGEVPSYMMTYEGGNDEDFEIGVRTELTQNGDFRSPEAIELLKEADIVVTNPPFSLFREYVAQLIEYDKKFIIMGNKNAITYKEFFPLLKDNKVWVGATSLNGGRWMIMPKNIKIESDKAKTDSDGNTILNVAGVCWFTNLINKKRTEKIETTYLYSKKDELYPDLYPKYDNYDAINVDKVVEIPMDYEPCWYKCPYAENCAYAETKGKDDNALCENACNGAIGVPISYVDKHNPNQFEIINANDIKRNDVPNKAHGLIKDKEATITQRSQFVNVEREREREREFAQHMHESLFANCHKCNGIIGVPISFFDKFCPEQFEILGIANSARWIGYECFTIIDGRKVYNRIIIRKKCNGYMGVPVTFMDKYNPNQFEIVGCFNNYNPETADPTFAIFGNAVAIKSTKSLFRGPVVNGESKYFRIIIKKKNNKECD